MNPVARSSMMKSTTEQSYTFLNNEKIPKKTAELKNDDDKKKAFIVYKIEYRVEQQKIKEVDSKRDLPTGGFE